MMIDGFYFKNVILVEAFLTLPKLVEHIKRMDNYHIPDFVQPFSFSYVENGGLRWYITLQGDNSVQIS